MAASEAESKSFLRRHWEGYKEFWSERFSFLDNYAKFIKREKPLTSWSESDVEEFIASDPVHGPTIEVVLEEALGGIQGILEREVLFFGQLCKVRKREKPLTSWSESDVEEFIASDPIHGLTLKTAREAVKYAAVGSVIGAVSTAGVAWKYSKSPHGAALSFGAGAMFGWTFGQEIGSHWLQLYRLDTMAAQVKFLEWWKSKTEGQS